MTNWNQLENEYNSPPDDKDEPCDRCGRLRVLSEYDGECLCDKCLSETIADEEE